MVDVEFFPLQYPRARLHVWFLTSSLALYSFLMNSICNYLSIQYIKLFIGAFLCCVPCVVIFLGFRSKGPNILSFTLILVSFSMIFVTSISPEQRA